MLLYIAGGARNLISNKKFWEELIRLLSLHKSFLFEVPEPNLKELNITELTLTLFNRIYCSKQLGYHGYHET
jgi:hypothetical protein